MDPVGSMLWGGVEGPVWGRRVAEGRGSSERGGASGAYCKDWWEIG